MSRSNTHSVKPVSLVEPLGWLSGEAAVCVSIPWHRIVEAQQSMSQAKASAAGHVHRFRTHALSHRLRRRTWCRWVSEPDVEGTDEDAFGSFGSNAPLVYQSVGSHAAAPPDPGLNLHSTASEAPAEPVKNDSVAPRLGGPQPSWRRQRRRAAHGPVV